MNVTAAGSRLWGPLQQISGRRSSWQLSWWRGRCEWWIAASVWDVSYEQRTQNEDDIAAVKTDLLTDLKKSKNVKFATKWETVLWRAHFKTLLCEQYLADASSHQHCWPDLLQTATITPNRTIFAELCVSVSHKKVSHFYFRHNSAICWDIFPIFEAFCLLIISAWYSLLHTHHQCEGFSWRDVTHDVSNKMLFAIDDKHVIKVLRQENRYSSQRFLKEFPNKNWTCSFLV